MDRYVEIKHGHLATWQLPRGEDVKPFAKMIGKSIVVGLLAGLPAVILMSVYWWI